MTTATAVFIDAATGTERLETIENAVMDNSGKGKLRVPGINLPLRLQRPPGERFAHGIIFYCQTVGVTAREFAMTATMNNITDKPAWWTDIHDDKVVSRWKQEAFQKFLISPPSTLSRCHDTNLMSEKAWEWCLLELHDKAIEYEKKRFVRVFDTGSCVCKTDELLSSVAEELKAAFDPLFAEPDGADEQRRYVVDPCLYPLVYGTTRVLDGEYINLSANSDMHQVLISDTRTAQTALEPTYDNLTDFEPERLQELIDDAVGERRKGYCTLDHVVEIDESLWSTRYQCLPCDVSFSGEGTGVKCSSYVNNLYPGQDSVYGALEQVISASVKMWNECVMKGQTWWESDEPIYTTSNATHVNRNKDDPRQRGRYPLRIITYGADWHDDSLPTWAASFFDKRAKIINDYHDAKAFVSAWDGEPPNWSSDRNTDIGRAFRFVDFWSFLEGIPRVPPATEEIWQLAEQYLETPLERQVTSALVERYRYGVSLPHWARTPAIPQYDRNRDEDSLPHLNAARLLAEKGGKSRYWLHPEPGVAFSYQDWVEGNNINKAVVDIHAGIDWKERRMSVMTSNWSMSIKVFRSFDWQWFGHMNEHIVATAIYAYDVSNAECSITFAQDTDFRHGYRCRGRQNWDPYHLQYDDGMSTPVCPRDPAESASKFELRSDCEDMPALAQTLNLGDLGWPDGDVADLPSQDTGRLDLPHGRLITFPNVLEYNIEAKLKDTTSGHIRMVTLHLVDPGYRICSTGNVAPQQPAWWKSPVGVLLERKLPRELVDVILEMAYSDYPMSPEQAEWHRKEMRGEQTWITIARHGGMGHFKFGLPFDV